MKPIKVLVVDDSALMRNLIPRVLESDKDIKVVDTAVNGKIALDKTMALNPDIVILDLVMPELDGIGYLEQRRERGLTVPVIILSAVAIKGARLTMRALALGASDFITKPSGTSEQENQEAVKQLIGMIKGYGATYSLKQKFAESAKSAPQAVENKDLWPEITPVRSPAPPQIVAIGISTGGPNALRQVFAELSENFPVPIVVVQHMPEGFTAEFAKSLDNICPLKVKEAEDGDHVTGGQALIAPGNRHVQVVKKLRGAEIRTTDSENVNGHKPSVGVLFESVAHQYGNAALALIMTGMGRDGAREIGHVYAEGGLTMAQDEKSSVVYGMPRVATEHNYISRIVSLDEVASVLNKAVGAV